VKIARLIAVVVALVVPLQGMASVMAGQCMAFGHHDAPAMDHDAHASHDGHEQDSHDNSDGNHCGPCAACCASVAMTGTEPLVIEPDTFSAPYAFVPQPPVRLAPDELDRPPLAL
jgi:hypothetical protein